MAVESDTAVLPVRPVDGLPPAGDYPLRLDGCVVEVSVRLLGRPLIRIRLRASGGNLVVGEPTTLDLELRADARRIRVRSAVDVTLTSGALPGRSHLVLAAEFTR